MASGACRSSYFGSQSQQVLSHYIFDAYVKRIRQPLFRMPIKLHFFFAQTIQNFPVQPIPQRLDALAKTGEIAQSYFACMAKPDYVGHVLGSSAFSLFLSSAVHEVVKFRSVSDV